MSKEQKPSKKAVREKKASILEDATFGLKNKNKSSKVKLFIDRVEKTVKNSNGGAEAAKRNANKKDTLLAKQLQEEELRLLFNEGITNQFGKKKSSTKGAAAALGITEANKDVASFLDGLSSDSSDNESEDERHGGRKTIYIESEDVPTEVFREKTIEDIIEEQRTKLAAEGKVGTPVTADSFAKWRTAKLLQRQAEAEARVKAEQMKKKGGKGLSVLSGKELFSYNAALFVDDDAAINADDEVDMQRETKKDAAREEAAAKEESDRIQAEQQRLFEIQQIEFEVRRQKDEERRRLAKEAKITFVLNRVVINQIVFEDDEIEDLAPFPEEKLVEAIEHVATDISNANSSSGAFNPDREAGADNEDEEEGENDGEGDEQSDEEDQTYESGDEDDSGDEGDEDEGDQDEEDDDQPDENSRQES